MLEPAVLGIKHKAQDGLIVSCVLSQRIIMPRASKFGRNVVMPLMCLHFKGRFEKIESLNLKGAVEAKRRPSFILIWRSERLLGLRLQ